MLNVRDVTRATVSKNEEITNLVRILGLTYVFSPFIIIIIIIIIIIVIC